MSEKKTVKPANDTAPEKTPNEAQKKNDAEGNEAAQDENAHTALEASESEPEDQPEDAQASGDPVAKLESDLAEFRDKHLRALAEIENVRRRGEKEKADALKYASTEFAKDMLGVADNLRRAIEAVPAEAAESDGAIKTLLEGVEMTERELLAIFERHGIKRIEADGAKFDHNLHQAMMEVSDSGQPAGTVVQVLQTGYTIHDRLLRPAMVAVAKGDGGNKGKDDKGGGKGGEAGSKVDTNA